MELVSGSKGALGIDAWLVGLQAGGPNQEAGGLSGKKSSRVGGGAQGGTGREGGGGKGEEGEGREGERRELALMQYLPVSGHCFPDLKHEVTET